MCDCESLRERIAWLESELGMQRSASREAELTARFGLTASQAKIVARLASRPGDTVSVYGLEMALTLAETPECSENLVRVHMSRIRHKMPGCVETVRSRGYRLTEKGRQEISRLTPDK